MSTFAKIRIAAMSRYSGGLMIGSHRKGETVVCRRKQVFAIPGRVIKPSIGAISDNVFLNRY